MTGSLFQKPYSWRHVENELETEWEEEQRKMDLPEHFCETQGLFYFSSSFCIYPLAFSFGLQVRLNVYAEITVKTQLNEYKK